ncbi:MAG TPA: V-type ATP synthase subunit D [Candidatus Scybalocola faecigallinarum]|uniref:V-type ATP synthase subunit D n=1 Tax=Candidatus Scybalocola faecigallinarum TaxID=2840941 RepID=A0A9D1F4D3_9FIRM|nr:V-type ATP synthase subunit D [Candidatus Scybalocola faecigallinarum]
MDPNEFPTKGNLILAKNSLALANQGYDLMDKKRNILIRELMELTEKAQDIQKEIDVTFKKAYGALQKANIEMGIMNVENISYTVPEENSIRIKYRSIMGTEIPLVEAPPPSTRPAYDFYHSTIALDEAVYNFTRVKELTLKLATIETSAYRLAASIIKTRKRANALQNITIPRYTALVKTIQTALEEKEREDFTRLKVIKNRKGGT